MPTRRRARRWPTRRCGSRCPRRCGSRWPPARAPCARWARHCGRNWRSWPTRKPRTASAGCWRYSARRWRDGARSGAPARAPMSIRSTPARHGNARRMANWAPSAVRRQHGAAPAAETARHPPAAGAASASPPATRRCRTPISSCRDSCRLPGRVPTARASPPTTPVYRTHAARAGSPRTPPASIGRPKAWCITPPMAAAMPIRSPRLASSTTIRSRTSRLCGCRRTR
ncbi:hypothetical protein D3C72_1149250 [compost metagenome]